MPWMKISSHVNDMLSKIFYGSNAKLSSEKVICI